MTSRQLSCPISSSLLPTKSATRVRDCRPLFFSRRWPQRIRLYCLISRQPCLQRGFGRLTAPYRRGKSWRNASRPLPVVQQLWAKRLVPPQFLFKAESWPRWARLVHLYRQKPPKRCENSGTTSTSCFSLPLEFRSISSKDVRRPKRLRKRLRLTKRSKNYLRRITTHQKTFERFVSFTNLAREHPRVKRALWNSS